MISGMLWQFSNAKEIDISKEITDAADYFLKKYGAYPNKVWINASYQDVPDKINGIRIEQSNNIGKVNLWIGIDKNVSE